MATVAPTTLQVTASTSQAVSAFNALANAIAAAQRGFANLGATMQQSMVNAQRFNRMAEMVEGSFSRITSAIGNAISVVKMFAGGIEFVFSSIVKELDKLQGFNAIMSVTTKSSDDVARSYDFLRGVADKLGVQFDSLTNNYAKLVASLPQGAQGLKTAETVFLGIAEAARTLHASNNDIQLMFYAVTQMASKGTVSMEELRRQLGEKLPGTMQIAARSLNTLPETLEAAIRKGIVSSEKFLPIFGATLVRTFSESAELASHSVSASLNRLTNVWTDFVKTILDSGAGQSIANVFDAIREKLSDPYIVERFAALVKYLGDRFTEFVQSLTAEDMRRGFDSFSHAVQVVVTLVEKLIELLGWIITHGATVGAIVGGLAGVSMGAVAGPYGALAGGLVGAAGGAYAGYKLTDTGTDEAALRQKYDMSDTAVRARQQQLAEQQAQYKIQILTGPLQQFKGLNDLNGLSKLFDASRLNQKTIDDLNSLLQDKNFKTDAQRLQGLKDYAQYGTLLPPQNSTLADVLGTGKNKKSAEEKSMDATLNRAYGLNANYTKELENLNKLYQSGKLDIDTYVGAVEDLIMKQPFAVEMTKEQTAEMKLENKAILENFKSYDQQQLAIDKLNRSLDEELSMARLTNDERNVEASVMQATNSLKEVGRNLTQEETAALREQYRMILEINKVTAAKDQFLQATVNRLEPQIQMLKGIQEALADPTSGATKMDAQNYLVGQNQDLFKGTEEYYQYQKTLADDMYSYLKVLRENDFISEETYNRLKTQTQVKLYQEQVDAANFTFGTLSTLMKSKSLEAFEIGKAASVAQALISAYEAINKAWTLPYPWNIAAAAAVGAATFANVRAIAATQMGGYAAGGYTGNGPVDQMAGVTHGREFVVNSNATARHRAALEAMNAGRWTGGEGGGGGDNVTVIVNAPPGSRVEKQDRQTNNGREIELTIRAAVSKDIKQGGPISEALQSQYGLNRSVGASR